MKLPVEYLISNCQQNLYKAAFSILRNSADAEDAVQDTFITYANKDLDFDSEDHIRNWLFKTCINRSKDIRKSFFTRNRTSWQEYMTDLPYKEPEDRTLFETVMKLPQNQRIVLQLYYYEDYSVKEIADILDITQSNVKTRLARARRKLKEILKEE